MSDAHNTRDVTEAPAPHADTAADDARRRRELRAAAAVEAGYLRMLRAG
jgi:hypothetical protein